MGRSVERVSFGRYLRSIRTERGVSLERLAEETKIGPGVLEAIEEEDFQRLPPPVFARGFLRAYARVVEADGDEVIRRYDAHRNMRRLSGEERHEPAREGLGMGGKLLISLALLAALIVVCLFGYRYWAAPGDGEPVLGEGPASEAALSAPASDNAASGSPVASPTPPAAGKTAQVLTITAQEDCWVKVVIDQGTATEHKLKAGGQVRLEARSSFNLLIGNAGGVKLQLNNAPVQVPGKRGEVINMHLP
jgi:cytoskeletal protein RodZ